MIRPRASRAVAALLLLSLAGLPPLAGFIGKYYVFAAAIQGHFITLTIFAAVNSVIAAYYYFRIIRLMYLTSPTGPAFAVPSKALTVALWILFLSVLALGIFPGFFITRVLG